MKDGQRNGRQDCTPPCARSHVQFNTCEHCLIFLSIYIQLVQDQFTKNEIFPFQNLYRQTVSFELFVIVVILLFINVNHEITSYLISIDNVNKIHKKWLD